MSEMQTVEVNFNDEEVLIGALKNLGYNPAQYEKSKSIKVYYQNKGKPKANIVISKNQFGGYADVGFERQEKGFRMHLDNMDHKKFKVHKLKQFYSEGKIMKSIKKHHNFSIINRKEQGGKIRIRVRRTF